MSLFKRVLISIWQRRDRTLLFLGLFVIVFSLMLAGFAIQESAAKSKVEARKKLGAEVQLKIDNDKVRDAIISGKGSIKPLSKKTVDEISFLKQVKRTQKSAESGGARGELKPTEPTKMDDQTQNSGPIASNGDKSKMPAFTIRGTNNLEESKDFKNHDSRLIDGVGITDKSKKNSAVIEETFAKDNHLKVGDDFNLQFSPTIGAKKTEKKHTYKVVGVYKSTKNVSPVEQTMAMTIPANQIYIDINSYLTNGNNKSIDDVTYVLKDPITVDQFMDDAKNKMSSNDEYFKLEADTDEYEQMIGSIEKMSAFSSIMITVIVVAGSVILTLLSLLSVRDRKKEVGILLSLGSTKVAIIIQLVTEMLIIGSIAFGLSFAFVQYTGQSVTDSILSSQVEKSKSSQEKSKSSQEKSSDEFADSEGKRKDIKEVDKLELDFDRKVISISAALGLLLILITTLIPSTMISKMDPKDLFSQNE